MSIDVSPWTNRHGAYLWTELGADHMKHVDDCLLTRFPGDLRALHLADDKIVVWLRTQGCSFYDKKEG